MTMTLFTVVIGIFLFGAIYDMYVDAKDEIEKRTITWKKVYTHRSFSTVLATALVWYVVIGFHLTVTLAFILLGLALIACLLFIPTKRKIQQKIAEKKERKSQNEKQKFYEMLDEYRKDRNL